jgi:hypothetical protein
MPHPLVSQDHIDSYQRDGVTLIQGLFRDHVEILRRGVETNMVEPGVYESENLRAGEDGRFFDDYCNWQRIPEFEAVVRTSPAAEVASDLMQSNSVQVFHDHVLVKNQGLRNRPLGIRTHPIISLKAGRRSASGRRSTRCGRPRCVALRDRTFGRSQCCRRAGCQRRTSTRAQRSICRCPNWTPRGWRSWNGRWSLATRWPLPSAPSMVPAAVRALRRRAVSLRLIGDNARYVE